MIVAKTVYVKRLPPRNTLIYIRDAISSCSPEEIKKANPKPDLHYFEIYWYTQTFGGVQKNILRLLFPSYRDAVEQHDIMYKKLFGNTDDWVDDYYNDGIKALQKEIKISKENRMILEEWRQKYDQGLR